MGLHDYILTVARQALLLVLVLSAPILLVSVAVGLLFGILQAATQIQEQTLSFVPKLIAVAVTLAVTASWIGGQLVRFATVVWSGIPRLGG
jgi:flagellar biosynthesis protein FliQ